MHTFPLCKMNLGLALTLYLYLAGKLRKRMLRIIVLFMYTHARISYTLVVVYPDAYQNKAVTCASIY